MNETWIRELAERYGLEVLKRITVGNTGGHFATFELTGDRAGNAWAAIRAEGHSGVWYGPPSNPDYPDRRPYITIEPVWCEL